MTERSRKHVCPVCHEFARTSYAGILRHIGEVHSFSPDFRIVCGLGSEKCPATYTNFQSFRSHVYKKHREVLTRSHGEEDNDTTSLCPSVNDGDNGGLDVSINGAQDGEDEDQITRAAALFILKTMEIHRTSQV